MPKLFKNKLIKEKLQTFEVSDLEEKIAVLGKWTKALLNNSLHSKTESQCEQAFNQDIFVNILGYSMFPTTPYTIEPKASTETSGQKPDAALGFFEGEKARVQVVCEIKDSKTSLDKSQKREGNLSPIQQAFKYKPQYKDCRFVIATNFVEIRLYRDNQLDFESFNLLNLVSEKDNYFEFRKFYFLLCSENMLSKRGESKTERLLSEIRIEQEHITKDFYKEYKALRYQLIDNIIKNNSEKSVSLVIEKAQKLIDRIVFVCFCEDIDLLPENKLVEVIEYAKKGVLDQPVWDVMKLFFVAIDKGSKKLGIPDGYNGELFKPDLELDSLLIDDYICEQFVKLGRYDFSEDLSVNILGHIFEQSISDLENLRAEYEGQTIQKKDSKRKKDGIYYTPDYIVDYIVNQAVGGYLKDQESVILEKHGLKEGITQENYDKRHVKAYEEYQTVLRNIKVLDPACGSGAFLVKVFDYLLAENARVSEILTQSRGGMTTFMDTESYTKDILQNNIYGVDINAESVEITKLSLWLKTAQKGKKLATLKDNIKCGNSLIDDPEVAGAKAFKWEDEFKDIMDAGGFDVVVGNPPYFIVSNSHLNKLYLEKKYLQFKRNNEIYCAFFIKSLGLIKDSGRLSFITPNTYLRGQYFSGLRNHLRTFQIKEIVDFGSDLIFSDANVYTSTILLKKAPPKDTWELKLGINFSDPRFEIDSDQSEFYYIPEILKMMQDFEKIGEAFFVKDVGYNYWTIGRGKIRGGSVADRIFYSGLQINAKDKPFCKGSNIFKYFISSPQNFLINNYKEQLSDQDVFRFSQELLEVDQKIIYRQTASSIMASLDNDCLHVDKTCHIIINNKYESLNLKYLLGVLNSTLINYCYQLLNQESGKAFSQIKTIYIKQLPFILGTESQVDELIQITTERISLAERIYSKTNRFKTYIQSTYTIEKLPKSFDKFYDLEFSDIQKALKKLKVSLSKKDEFELMELFEDQTKQALELKAKIDQTDREIDQMVYELYGLTEEEIKIVEEATQ